MRVNIAGTRHHKCDWCKEDFTDRSITHITFEVGARSGLAQLDNPLPGWRFTRVLKPGYLDFCGAACLAQWAAVVLEGAALMPEYVG